MSLVLDTVAALAAETPEAIALTTPDSGGISYGALMPLIWETADGLDAALGSVPRERPIATALENGLAWILTDLALMQLGRVSLPLPLFFSKPQRAHALKHAGAAAIVTDAASPGAARFRVAGEALDVHELDHAAISLPPGTAKITFTSGTTAAPKGVCLSQGQLEAVASALVSHIGRKFAGIHVPALPLSVLLENVAGLYVTLLAGGTYCIAHPAPLGLSDPFHPDFRRLSEALYRLRATSTILVPELLRGLVAHLNRDGRPLEDLRFVAVGGARISPSLLDAAAQVGLPVFEGYGLSECGSVVALNTPKDHRRGTVGKVLSHLDVSVEADGEIIVGPAPFLGYVGERHHNGRVQTGDLGSLDADGFLRVTGRKKNLIVTSFGRNISPEWIESELTAQPEIARAVVFGEADRALSAIVTPAPAFVDPDDVARAVARVNAALPGYARIGSWRNVPSFAQRPAQLTPNGRVRRPEIFSAHRDFLRPTGPEADTCPFSKS